MRNGLKSRIAKLEKRRKLQSTNRLLTYNPHLLGSKEQALKNAEPGNYMLTRFYENEAEWEKAAIEQQTKLLAKANQPQ